MVRMDDRDHYGASDGGLWTDTCVLENGYFKISKHCEARVTHVLSPTLGPIPDSP